MSGSGKYIQPTERKLSPVVIALGVIMCLVVATGLFFLGLVCVGPMIRAHFKTTPRVEQTVQSPAVAPTPEQSTEAPAAADSKDKKPGALDVQITEDGKDQSSDTTPTDNGVKQDANGLTVTLDPQTQQKDGQTSPPADASAAPAESPKPRSHPDRPKVDAQPVQDTTPAERVTPAPSGKTHYRVQTGTFANKNNADSVASDLRDHGYKPEVKVIQSEAGTLYRVELGEYKTRQGAQDLADELASKGYNPSVTTGRKN